MVPARGRGRQGGSKEGLSPLRQAGIGAGTCLRSPRQSVAEQDIEASSLGSHLPTVLPCFDPHSQPASQHCPAFSSSAACHGNRPANPPGSPAQCTRSQRDANGEGQGAGKPVVGTEPSSPPGAVGRRTAPSLGHSLARPQAVIHGLGKWQRPVHRGWDPRGSAGSHHRGCTPHQAAVMPAPPRAASPGVPSPAPLAPHWQGVGAGEPAAGMQPRFGASFRPAMGPDGNLLPPVPFPH